MKDGPAERVQPAAACEVVRRKARQLRDGLFDFGNFQFDSVRCGITRIAVG